MGLIIEKWRMVIGGVRFGLPSAEEYALWGKRRAAKEQIQDHARGLLGEGLRFPPLTSLPGAVRTEDGIQVGAVTRDGRALVSVFEEIDVTK